MSYELKNDVFTLRAGEWLTFHAGVYGCRYAVILRSVEPPGQAVDVCQSGVPPESCAVLAAERKLDAPDRWQWMHLSPATKEVIGDMLLDEVKAPMDTWIGFEVLPTPPLSGDNPS